MKGAIRVEGLGGRYGVPLPSPTRVIHLPLGVGPPHPPTIQAPGGRRSAVSRTSATSPSASTTSRRFTPRRSSPARLKWVWLSMKPG